MRQARLLKAVDIAYGVFASALPESGEAKDYLANRKLPSSFFIEGREFHLGFCKQSALVDYVKKFGDSELLQEFLDLGLVKKSESSGRHYDAFLNRVIIPIVNDGKVIGFGGRDLSGKYAKYINSDNSELFNKSQSYFLAGPALNERDAQLLVVEGFFDAIAVAARNDMTAMASMGTSITDEQIQILLSKTGNICFVYDGDKAGVNALKRAALKCLPFCDQAEFSFCELPEKHDPDSFIHDYGHDAFVSHLALNRQTCIEYLFRGEPQALDDQISFMAEVTGCLKGIKSEQVTANVLKELSSWVYPDLLDELFPSQQVSCDRSLILGVK
jgi:DNA primase